MTPDTKLPDEPNEETPGGSTDASEGQIPVNVQEALGDVCHGLSADQATALASLFTAVESGPYDDGVPQAKPTPAHGRASPGPWTIRLEPNAKIGPTGKMLLQILEHYPQKSKISIYSAYRPGEPDHHGGQSINGSPTAALDIIGGKAPGMRDVAKWLYENFAAETLELIHTTPFNDDDGFYVKNGKKYPGGEPKYDAEIREQHRDHVHFATSEALAKKILARLNKKQSRASSPAAAPVWGWDASSYDWDRGPMNLMPPKRMAFSSLRTSAANTAPTPSRILRKDSRVRAKPVFLSWAHITFSGPVSQLRKLVSSSMR